MILKRRNYSTLTAKVGIARRRLPVAGGRRGAVRAVPLASTAAARKSARRGRLLWKREAPAGSGWPAPPYLRGVRVDGLGRPRSGPAARLTRPDARAWPGFRASASRRG